MKMVLSNYFNQVKILEVFLLIGIASIRLLTGNLFMYFFLFILLIYVTVRIFVYLWSVKAYVEPIGMSRRYMVGLMLGMLAVFVFPPAIFVNKVFFYLILGVIILLYIIFQFIEIKVDFEKIMDNWASEDDTPLL